LLTIRALLPSGNIIIAHTWETPWHSRSTIPVNEKQHFTSVIAVAVEVLYDEGPQSRKFDVAASSMPQTGTRLASRVSSSPFDDVPQNQVPIRSWKAARNLVNAPANELLYAPNDTVRVRSLRKVMHHATKGKNHKIQSSCRPPRRSIYTLRAKSLSYLNVAPKSKREVLRGSSTCMHRPGIEPGAGRIIRDDISYGNGQFYH
jgi:hypothetical protein